VEEEEGDGEVEHEEHKPLHPGFLQPSELHGQKSQKQDAEDGCDGVQECGQTPSSPTEWAGSPPRIPGANPSRWTPEGPRDRECR
jgi:hypothetical protein